LPRVNCPVISYHRIIFLILLQKGGRLPVGVYQLFIIIAGKTAKEF
jgi:hypothetical protein